MTSDTTTTFLGDIKFKDGDTIRLASELATVDEVNNVLKDYYTKAECDKLIQSNQSSSSSTSSSSSSSYEAVPYKIIQHDNNDTYQFDTDIKPNDTLRFTGFFGLESNTFSYEATLTLSNGSSIYQSEQITTSLGQKLQISMMFVEDQRTRFMIASKVIFTSIEKKVSTYPSKFKTIPFETRILDDVQEMWSSHEFIVFDGSFGDAIKMDFRFAPNNSVCSIYTTIEKIDGDIHMVSGNYISSNNLVDYNTVMAVIQSSPNYPGKLILRCANDFTLVSVSIPYVSDASIHISDFGIAPPMKYEPVSLQNLRDGSSVLYDVDVEFGDTVLIEGYYVDYPFSWEGVLNDDKEVDDSKAAVIEFKEQDLYIIFISKPKFERMTLMLDSRCIITSLKRKTASDDIVLTSSMIASHSLEERTSIPFYCGKVNGNIMVIFDGSFGDTITIEYMLYTNQYRLTSEHKLVKDAEGKYDVYDRVPIPGTNNVRYTQIGLISEHTDLPGKLIFMWGFEAYQLLSISKWTTSSIVTTRSLNSPVYSSCVTSSRDDGNTVFIDAKRGDVIHITGKSKPGDDSFTFDCMTQIPTTGSELRIPTSKRFDYVALYDNDDGGLILTDSHGVICFESVEHVYANEIERLEAKIATLEAKLNQLTDAS